MEDTYHVAVNPKGDYLHVVITGANTKANVLSYLEDIKRECISRRCYKVLIEEHLEGPRLGPTDVYEIAQEGAAKARGVAKAFAYLDANADGDLMKFAETVGYNRGLPIAVFTTLADAEAWIAKQ